MDLTEFQAVLDQLTVSDILRAAADHLDEVATENTFHPPRSWFIRIAGHDFPHRPIIARAARRHIEREMEPSDFGGNNDKRARWWLGERGFETLDL
ncbi:hypothetical protein R5W24_004902 [Gemmata sp. JC717]|uniref:hypothetical protein n=1 Tax=Gemmata algarum TaxID=2975278 RepID=UPI0021BA9877|nr:hypothetical protein [Gemmata algarum]MDY3555756.1 hypothetical protein [Gemmata algarum]